jgi:hypothetical protein
MTSIFSADFRKILKYQTSLKSVSWEPSCSKRTDGHDEVTVAFSNFANAPKKKTQVETFRVCSKNANHSLMIFDNLRVAGILTAMSQLR